LRGFTLIEVLVSTLIVFIAVSVVLNITSNTTKFFSLIVDRNDFALKSSIIFLEQNKSKNLYENLIDFNITNDSIIHTLKHTKLSFKRENSIKMDFNFSNRSFQFYIDKLKVYSNKNSAYGYEVGIR